MRDAVDANTDCGGRATQTDPSRVTGAWEHHRFGQPGGSAGPALSKWPETGTGQACSLRLSTAGGRR